MQNCGLSYSSWPQSKIERNWKKDKYKDLARELWNMKVTIIPNVIGALGTVTKGLIKGLEDMNISGRVETIQTTALLKTARILRGVLETCCHLSSCEKPLMWKTKLVNNNNDNNNNIQTTALLRTARILRRVLETWGDLLSLKLQWKTIS